MVRKRIIALALSAFAFIAPSFAQDGDVEFKLEGVRFLYSLIPTGVDVSLTYTGFQLSDAAQTQLFLKVGGGYEDTVLLRAPLTGDPSSIPDPEKSVVGTGFGFNKPNFQWELAFIQGLATVDSGKNSLEAFAFYRGRLDFYPNEGQSDAVFTDMQGIFGTSFLGGISYDTVVQSRHRSKQGVYAEASGEWGPGFLNVQPQTDFWRVSGQVRGFLPVYDIPTEGGNLFNLYLAGFAGADYADGVSVPIYVNQSFGGRNLRGTVGDCVRGYGWNAYDTKLKAVANAEVRLVGPAIVLDAIVPYLFGFADAGYYSGFADSANYSGASGFLSSVGGGVALDLVGFAQVSVIAGFRLIDDQAVTYAYDYDAFFWGLKFFLHF